jgi:hypothetical protein
MTIVVPPEPTVTSSHAGRTRPRHGRPHVDTVVQDLVDVWGRDSFPASDPPANW